MATIYGDAKGVLLRFLRNEDEEERFPEAPAGTAYTVRFDELTNPAVVDALNTDWNSHDLVGGVLRRNGQAVSLAADSQEMSDRKALGAVLGKLQSDRPLTPEEIATVLRWLIHQSRGRK